MKFSSSHGLINWSFRNYGIFIENLHEQMTDAQTVIFNTFQSYIFSDFGYPPEKCQSLVDVLEIIQPKLTEDDASRCEKLIDALTEARLNNSNLRFQGEQST